MTLATIENESVTWDGTKLAFMGHGRIDDDGSGEAHNDPYHQSDTSLHHFGRPLNADVDFYAVLPEQLAREVAPIVLGCQGYATYKGTRYPLVLGDLGPRNRLGEISEALAIRMGINPNPNTGGDDNEDIFFEFYPGVPAVVNGTTYSLQSLS
jgi:hypothetical protein